MSGAIHPAARKKIGSYKLAHFDPSNCSIANSRKDTIPQGKPPGYWKTYLYFFGQNILIVFSMALPKNEDTHLMVAKPWGNSGFFPEFFPSHFQVLCPTWHGSCELWPSSLDVKVGSQGIGTIAK